MKISQISAPRRRTLAGRLAPLVLTLCVTLLNTPAQGAVTLPDAPLFVLTAGKANVLMVLDDSNSMDEFPSGAAAGSDNPGSKSEIARNVIKGLITRNTGKINMGLMSYKQNDPAPWYLHSSPYDASYDPATYDPTFTGNRASATKKYRAPNPTSPGDYVYYNVALPFYSSINEGNLFCYSAGSGFPSGPNSPYDCYNVKTGSSNAGPPGAGYSSRVGTFNFGPTDSDFAQGISSFGQRLVSSFVARTWYRNDSPGRGYLYLPVKDLDATQAAAFTSELASDIPDASNNPTSSGLKNAGLTPMEGTLLTAKDYLGGSWSNTSEGYASSGPLKTYPLPTTCKKSFVVLLTDGLPSNDKNGNVISDPAIALKGAADAAAALEASGIDTYVVGFALPYGTDPNSLDVVAAAGGTKTAYSASDTTSLNDVLDAIFLDIENKTGSGGSVATNSTQLNTGTRVYKATFKPSTWSGTLEGFDITGGVVSASSAWSASIQPTTRNILTWNGAAGTAFPTAAQTAILTTPIVNYISGDRTGEGTTYRKRDSLLGDIVDSSPVYVDQGGKKTIYVGANDGMLHAFDASTGSAASGTEVFAYVPANLDFAALKTLSNPSYPHRFFVDGELAVSTTDQTPGKRILVGLLGRGGKAAYAIDVTDPGSPTVLWEKSAISLGLNFGNALGKPVIAKMNDGSTGVIIGNGYNGTTDRSSLFILDISTGAVLKEIDTGKGSVATPNGMASPKGWDTDRNGTVDLIYAGDLLGNVWEFDVSDKLPSKWTSVFTTGSTLDPLFIAKDASNVVQPITGGISVGLDPVTFDRWVFFGTGRYLTSSPSDPTNVQTQSWYGLMDDTNPIAGRSVLKQRKIVAQTTASGKLVRAFEAAVVGDMAGKKGWYVDLLGEPGDVQKGERMVSDQILFSSVLIAASIIPDTSSACAAGGRGYINAIDPFTGGSVTSPFFDINNDKAFNDKDKISDGTSLLPIGSVDLGVDMPSTPTIIDKLLITGGSAGTIGNVGVNNPAQTGRISWRELVGN
jgi:type IV pilus assembly protein PilY1